MKIRALWFACLLVIAATPTVAGALSIRIEQHTTSGFNSLTSPGLDAAPTLLKSIVETSAPSPAIQPVRHLLLRNCAATAQCTEVLGAFTFRDASATAKCRVEKNDGLSIGKFELKGCIIEVPTAAPAGNKFLRIVIESTVSAGPTFLPADYAPKQSGNRSYSLVVSGSFRRISSATADQLVRATSCGSAATDKFCVRAVMTANGPADPKLPNTVNFSPSETTATIAVNSGTSGFTTGGTGTLSQSDGEGPAFNATSPGIPCGPYPIPEPSCFPVVKTDYRFVFTPGDRLRLASSGSAGFGLEPDVTIDQDGTNYGFLALQLEFMGPAGGFTNRWFPLAFGGTRRWACEPEPPVNGATRNSSSPPIPVKFDCVQASQQAPGPLPLTASLADPLLPPAEQQYLGSSALFYTPVFPIRQFKDLKSLVFNYSFPEGKDCENGSVRVVLGLSKTSTTVPDKTVIVLLGNAPDFFEACAAAATFISGQNLLQVGGNRVIDPKNGCCTTLAAIQNQLGNENLLYVAFIVNHRLDGDPLTASQQVDINPIGTNGVGASITFGTNQSLESPSVFQPTQATQYTCSSDLPTQGVLYRFINRTDNNAVYTFPAQLQTNCQYHTSVPVSGLNPVTGGNEYDVQITFNDVVHGSGHITIFAQ